MTGTVTVRFPAAMPLFRDMLRSPRRLLPMLAGACAVAYFGYHALLAGKDVASLERRIEQAKAELAAAREEEERLMQRVALLRPQGLDLDMLDEQARFMLNLAHRDDVVILLNPDSSPAGVGDIR